MHIGRVPSVSMKHAKERDATCVADTHQEAFRANIFKEHDLLDFEEHHWINGRTPEAFIRLLDKREIKCAF